MRDGRVEVFAAGSVAAVNQLAEWLQIGPPAARVTEVAEQAADVAVLADEQGFRCG
jgi:acylphosphatase